jgi:hypothetical protein
MLQVIISRPIGLHITSLEEKFCTYGHRWFRHIHRMEDYGLHKQLLNCHPGGRWWPGRLLKRLLDDVNAETQTGHPGPNLWWNVFIIIIIIIILMPTGWCPFVQKYSKRKSTRVWKHAPDFVKRGSFVLCWGNKNSVWYWKWCLRIMEDRWWKPTGRDVEGYTPTCICCCLLKVGCTVYVERLVEERRVGVRGESGS